MMDHPHHPKHRFDSDKVESLLDPRRRLIDDPLEVVRRLGVRSGMRVVDLGCGAGFFTPALLSAVGEGGWVAAVDVQEPVLAFFRRHVGEPPNLESVLADMSATGLPGGNWDAVFIAFTLHEVVVVEALKEIRRLLKPGGLLAVLDWGRREPCPEREPGRRAGPPEDERLLVDALRRHLDAAGFTELACGEFLDGCQYWLQARKD
ncbi:MAG: methyltransferase domain-containing protein [Magnetococcales bacterium]|nr:methyltransferase domain-containing protein [Magnetococcales bacterium]